MISAIRPTKVTEKEIQKKLALLAKPDMNFIKRARLAENAFAGYSFANAWVNCPVAVDGAPQGDLLPISVSGHATNPSTALRLLLMEAVERHSSVFVGSEIMRRAKISEVDSPWAPEGISKNTTLRWVESRKLTGQDRVLVPAGFVYLGYGMEDEPFYTIADSTGCAAGEDHEKAAYRGLLEVVERDALATWWYNRIECPTLDFEDDEQLSSISTALHTHGRSLTLVDITNDLGIPVVAAFSADGKGRTIYFGCAADVCYKQAARRAASEMLQFWFWGKVSGDPPDRAQWLQSESLQTQSWLQPQRRTSLPLAATEEVPIRKLVEQLARSGYNSLVVDLTRPSIGIPVVRVLVPGLLSHMRHSGCGRLLEVPVQMGWLQKQRERRELMPYPCPI